MLFLRIEMPLQEQDRLVALLEGAGVTSCAWKRSSGAWLVRTDTVPSGREETGLLTQLRAGEVRFQEIAEEAFWSTRSEAF